MRLPLHRYLLLTFTTIVTLPAFAQSKEDKSGELSQIRLKFQKINKETNYRVVKLEDAEQILGHATDGGASLTGYYKGDTLSKIVEWVGLSTGVVQNEYYLDGGKLIFVFSNEKRFAYNDSLQAFDYTKLVPAFTGRYYFKNNQLYDVVFYNKRLKQSEKDDAASFLKRLKSYEALLLKNRK
jgi:hypothetical protein